MQDDFLDSLTPEQQKVFNEYDKQLKEMEAKVEAVPEDKSPSDIQRGYTPDPRDAGRQGLDGQKTTAEEAGKTLHDNEVEKDPLEDYPVKSPLPDNEQKDLDDLKRRIMEQDFDQERC